MPEVKSNADAGVKKVVLLNKADLPGKQVQLAEVKAWADLEGIDVYETSAKSGKNVNQVFTDLCKFLMTVDPRGRKAMGMGSNEGAVLGKGSQQEGNKEGGCCN